MFVQDMDYICASPQWVLTEKRKQKEWFLSGFFFSFVISCANWLKEAQRKKHNGDLFATAQLYRVFTTNCLPTKAFSIIIKFNPIILSINMGASK